MASSLPVTPSNSSQDLLQAHVDLWHQAVSYTKSIALGVALDLGVADAIHNRGGSATLPEILDGVGIDRCKLRALRRLMRVLATSGTFSASSDRHGGDAVVHGLTPASRLLVSGGESPAATSLAPFMGVNLYPILVSPLVKGMMAWFRLDKPGPSPFAVAYGEMLWERTDHDADLNALVNKALAADSRFLMPIFLKECGEVFDGVGSLVDVGGAAAAIAAAFPHIKCSVLDLPQVVADAPSGTNVEYVSGDMFESIPPAQVIFLKSTLHDWGDEECVKVLKNCKQAVAPRDEGGKVVIIDMVVGYGPQDIKHKEAQVFFDFYIMFINGAERDEQEWKDIFFRAGFSDYKIVSVLGVMSIIELYP
nr:O-methyltransferase 2300-like protein [Panicum virgatum]